MLIIHFVREGEDQPVCRRPECRDWLWAADPEAVTCPSCAPQSGDALPHPASESRRGAPPERRH